MGKKKLKIPTTMALRELKRHKIDFDPFLYPYISRGGTAASSKALGVDPHQVIKTLIMMDERARPLVILMHGDLEVATGRLAREIGCKRVSPCDPKVAEKHSGYQVGGTSPFGLKTKMPIYAQESIQDLEALWINGGKRGFLVRLTPSDLQVLSPVWVDVGVS